MKSLGLYIHIPFCRSKCGYCDFYSLPGRQDAMDDYLAALLREVTLWGQKARDCHVDTLYIGGGTPSWFGAERICRLLQGVRQSFALTPDCEITMEANPDSVTREGMTLLRCNGVNRLSMGVQSADEGELKTAGRPHSFAQAQQAVQWAGQAGFENISLDLIYGLPGQSMESWQDSVRRVLALQPTHLSCYGLKLEPGTPFWKRQGSLNLPDEDAQADAFLWLCRQLAGQGFDHYEISNFARPGYASRHNLKYWNLQEYLGLGPGAHSDFRGVRFGYARDLQGYIRGECAFSEWRSIPRGERLEEYIMLGLRTGQGIDGQGYARYGGRDWTGMTRQLQLLEQHGLMCRSGDSWHCTDGGFLVSNAIIGRLLDAMQE